MTAEQSTIEPITLDAYLKFVASRTAPLPTRKLQATHAVLGLVTEVGEYFDLAKKQLAYGVPPKQQDAEEELGDICFYACMLLNTVSDYKTIRQMLMDNSWDRDRDYDPGMDLCLFDLHNLLPPIHYIASMVLFNQTETLQPYQVHKLTCFGIDILRGVAYAAEGTGLPGLPVLWAKNRQKLELRYPTGFTREAAVARADKQGEQS